MNWEYTELIIEKPEFKDAYATLNNLEFLKKDTWPALVIDVMEQVQEYLDNGWELILTPGPDSLEFVEDKISTTASWNCIVWLAFFLSLIPTFGLSILFLFQKTTIYRLIRIRIKFRRKVEQQPNS